MPAFAARFTTFMVSPVAIYPSRSGVIAVGRDDIAPARGAPAARLWREGGQEKRAGKSARKTPFPRAKSVPANELQEVHNKLAALRQALQAAEEIGIATSSTKSIV